MLQDGRRVYYQYMFLHPRYAFGEPLEDINKLVSPDSTEYRARLNPEPSWVEAARPFLYPQSLVVVAIWLIALLIGAAWLASRKAFDSRFVVPCFLLASSIPMMLIVWHGDAIEVERHAQQLHLQIRLGLWMLSAFLIDGIITLRTSSTVKVVDDEP
jgi:hypothetical protein